MKKLALFLGLMLAGASARATVVSQNISATFTCTGTTGPFAFTFSISAANAITVNQNGTALSPTAYVVTPVNNNYDNGGSVTLNAACPNAQTLTITRTTPLTQNTVFADNMPNPQKSIENGLDKLTEIAQELGKNGGGGGSGSVTGVSVATANGFSGTVLNPNTTPQINVSVDSTHVLPINTGNGATFLNNAGTYTIPSAGAAGATRDVQLNTSGALAADTGIFTYNLANHTLTTQVHNGKGNTDSFGSVSATLASAFCTGALGCLFDRPQTTSDTSNISTLFTTGSFLHGHDNSYGQSDDYFWNVGHDLSGNDFETAQSPLCFWNNTYSALLGGRLCENKTVVYAPYGGQYVNGEPSIAKPIAMNFWRYGRSIAQDESLLMYAYGIGDTDTRRDYLYHRTGSIAGNDESIEGPTTTMIGSPAPSGVVTTGGAGATTVKINFTSNAGNQADGLELLDTQTALDTGYVGALTVGAGNAASTFQTVDINGTPTTHTVSSGIATLTAACGSTTVRNQQQSNVCSVTINSGSFTSGGTNFVCVADWHYYEQAAITASTGSSLTLNLAYSHPLGTQIFQGGNCGGKIVLGNGFSSPLSNPQITSYEIAGAPDTTHYAVVIKNLGGQDGNLSIPWSQINPIIPGTAVVTNMVRSGNVVTAYMYSDGTAPLLNNYTAPGSSTIQVSGATPSDFNGTISGLAYDAVAQTLTWNQTGANESAGGATIALHGANNFSIYCGAEVIGVKVTGMSSQNQPVLDGTLNLEPNGCSWAANDPVIQPNPYNEHINFHFDTVSPAASSFNPLNNPNSYLFFNPSGEEWSGADIVDIDAGVNDPVGGFIGYGGVKNAYTYARLETGVWNFFGNMTYAPVASLFAMGCPPGGCTSTAPDVSLFQNNGVGEQDRFSFSTRNRQYYAQSTGGLGSPRGPLTGQSVGIAGTEAGSGFPLTTTLLTQVAFDTYSAFGNGAEGDSSANIGAGTFAAGNIVAGGSIPTNQNVFNSGTPGTTTYNYVCTGVTANGETVPGAVESTTTGNATLDATNFNIVKCDGTVGDQYVNYYRSSATGSYAAGRICTNVLPSARLCEDTGQTAGAAVPTVDTSGVVTFAGVNRTGAQGNGTKFQFATGGFTSGHVIVYDANGNASDGGALPAAITSGSVPLVAGTATVSTAAAVAISGQHGYQLTRCVTGGTAGFISVGTITPGTSFVINSSSNTDTSTVCWMVY